MKTQSIRVLDVLVIGPLMIYGGAKLAKEQPYAGILLALFGVSTIAYNARNWLVVREQES